MTLTIAAGGLGPSNYPQYVYFGSYYHVLCRNHGLGDIEFLAHFTVQGECYRKLTVERRKMEIFNLWFLLLQMA